MKKLLIFAIITCLSLSGCQNYTKNDSNTTNDTYTNEGVLDKQTPTLTPVLSENHIKRMPNLSELTQKEAERVLGAISKELNIIWIEEYSDIVEKGIVIRSVPQEGEEITNNEVTVTISLGLNEQAIALKKGVTEVETYISNIGEVTGNVTSKILIQKARRAYDSSAEDIKKAVSNYQVLLDAEKAYAEYYTAEIEELIDQIGEVTLDDEEIIKKTRNKYDGLDKEMQLYVDNRDLLVEAEEKFNILQTEYIISLINSIGKVSLSSEELLDKIRLKYDSLPAENKKNVVNYDIYENAKTTFRGVLEKQYNKAISRLQVATDTFSGKTVYAPKGMPVYFDERICLAPMLVLKDGELRVYLILDYMGSEWIDWNNADFNIDGALYGKKLYFWDYDTGSKAGTVWESQYDILDKDEMDLLRKIADSEKTIVIFHGSDSNIKWTVPEIDKKGIKEILELYDPMIKLEKAVHKKY